jgi:hypothetical protein
MLALKQTPAFAPADKKNLAARDSYSCVSPNLFQGSTHFVCKFFRMGPLAACVMGYASSDIQTVEISNIPHGDDD